MLLDTKQLSELLKISEPKIRELRRRGMPYHQFSERNIRFNLAEVLKWSEVNNRPVPSEDLADE
jgi:excisionase family DNA binding protein